IEGDLVDPASRTEGVAEQSAVGLDVVATLDIDPSHGIAGFDGDHVRDETEAIAGTDLVGGGGRHRGGQRERDQAAHEHGCSPGAGRWRKPVRRVVAALPAPVIASAATAGLHDRAWTQLPWGGGRADRTPAPGEQD